MFADHRCLWNKRCENHNDRFLRAKLLEALRRQLSDQSVSFSGKRRRSDALALPWVHALMLAFVFPVDDVKSKFKNLRTVFKRELKAVRRGRAGERCRGSRWKHFQQLLFLRDDEDDVAQDPSPASTQMNDNESNDSAPGADVFSAPIVSVPAVSIPAVSTPAVSAPAVAAVSTSFADASASSAHVSTAVSPYHVLISASPDHFKSETGPASPPEVPSTSPALLSAESRCYWTEEKVEQLIRFYSGTCL